jgi:hypothetical protein
VTALIPESVEPRPQLILAVAAHEQRVEIEQLDLAVAEAAHRERTEPMLGITCSGTPHQAAPPESSMRPEQSPSVNDAIGNKRSSHRLDRARVGFEDADGSRSGRATVQS